MKSYHWLTQYKPCEKQDEAIRRNPSDRKKQIYMLTKVKAINLTLPTYMDRASTSSFSAWLADAVGSAHMHRSTIDEQQIPHKFDDLYLVTSNLTFRYILNIEITEDW